LGVPLRKLRVGLFVTIFFAKKKQKRIYTAIPHAKKHKNTKDVILFEI